jgi:small-conductance mechanosensitive channel
VVGLGVTFTLFGLAVAFEEGGPRWLGWVGALAALAALALGLAQWYLGSSVLLTNQLFPLVAFSVLAWMLLASVVLWLSSTE